METRRDAGPGAGGVGVGGAVPGAAPAPDPDPWAGTPVADDRLWPVEALAAALQVSLERHPEQIERLAQGQLPAERGPGFGLLLRATRVRAGLTQEAAGELLGVTPGTVSRWERGEFQPPRQADLPPTQEQILRHLSTRLTDPVNRNPRNYRTESYRTQPPHLSDLAPFHRRLRNAT